MGEGGDGTQTEQEPREPAPPAVVTLFAPPPLPPHPPTPHCRERAPYSGRNRRGAKPQKGTWGNIKQQEQQGDSRHGREWAGVDMVARTRGDGGESTM